MYNRIILIGNLTRDPEMRSTPAGIPVVHFTLAVRRAVKRSGTGGPSSGEPNSDQSTADFIPVVAWRRLAEICRDYLRKGRSVAVEGRIQVRSYAQNGEQRTFTEVVADNVQLLGRRPEESSGVSPRVELPVSLVSEPTPQPEEAPF